jgi:hypothetical protein
MLVLGFVLGLILTIFTFSRLLQPFSLLSATLFPALALVVPFSVAIEAFNIFALILMLLLSGKSFILGLALALVQEVLLVFIGGNSDDSGGGDVSIGDIARGGKGIDGGVIGGG